LFRWPDVRFHLGVVAAIAEQTMANLEAAARDPGLADIPPRVANRQSRRHPAAVPDSQKAGWNMPEWCKGAGVSKSTVYNWITYERTHGGDIAPRRVKIRGRTIIVESPAAYLARIHATQTSRVPEAAS
jgi:predicted DNA-binding transcriptional regulator AlpA